MSPQTRLAIALVAVVTGCAPAVVLKPPAEWPADWRGRHLYNTPRALIYATSDAAAGEADRLTNKIADAHDLPLPADEPTSKGLVVVLDRNDDVLFNDVEQLLNLFINGQAQIAGIERPDEQRAAQVREKLTKNDEDLAPILQHLLVMLPIPVADDAVSQSLDFPPNASPAVAWAGILPTDAQVRAQAGELTDAIVDMAARREQLPTSSLWLVKPLMPMISGTLAKEVLKQRDIAYESIVRQNDPEWIADRDARRETIKSWNVVRSGNENQSAYNRAYTTAFAASKRLPDDVEVLRVLAAAEYRIGRYEPALTTLDRIRSLEKQRINDSGAASIGDLAKTLMPNAGNAVDNAVERAAIGRPGDLAFRAMAAHKLGRTEEADNAYQQLKEQVNSIYRKDAEERAYLVEAAKTLGRTLAVTTQPASE